MAAAEGLLAQVQMRADLAHRVPMILAAVVPKRRFLSLTRSAEVPQTQLTRSAEVPQTRQQCLIRQLLRGRAGVPGLCLGGTATGHSLPS